MVTTIKITCDGVFIQTNSNRIHTTDERIVTDSTINVVNGANRSNRHHHHHQQRHRLGSHHGIADAPNKAPFNGITKRSISVHNIDSAPQSLPNLPIANEQPALVSPQLVQTLSRIKKTAKTTTTTAAAAEAEDATETDASPNTILMNSLSTSTDALSSLSAARSIHRVIRVDRNGKSVPRATPITSCTRQWDGNGTVVGKMKNGITNNTGAVVRRRNTFKSYLIECKENIVRRLSSPTPLIG